MNTLSDVHEQSISITEAIDYAEEAFLLYRHPKLGWCTGEIQQAGCYAACDPSDEGYMSDDGIYFDTAQQAERYYKREYKDLYAFDDEQDRDDAWRIVEDDMMEGSDDES